jgi:hypothetical protein
MSVIAATLKSCIRIAEIQAVLLHPMSFELNGGGMDAGCFRSRRPSVRSLSREKYVDATIEENLRRSVCLMGCASA